MLLWLFDCEFCERETSATGFDFCLSPLCFTLLWDCERERETSAAGFVFCLAVCCALLWDCHCSLWQLWLRC